MLHQEFYSIKHDPALPVTKFIKGVLSFVCKLNVIGHKPSDKILIGLDNSWSPVHTTLTLQSTSLTIDEITSALKQYKANEMGVKQEYGDSALNAKERGGGVKRRGDNGNSDEDFDWGNMKNSEGVCYRCGHPWHIAQFCIVNMPGDVKCHILSYSTHIATAEPDDHDNDDLFAFTAQQHTKPIMASSLSAAFSELALTELAINSIDLETPTTTVTHSESKTVIPKNRKKKRVPSRTQNWLNSHVNYYFLHFFYSSLLISYIHLISLGCWASGGVLRFCWDV